jgi:hypothetical protein
MVETHAATSSRVTASHLNSEVKLDRAEVVLSWGTRWEGSVLHVFFCFLTLITLPTTSPPSQPSLPSFHHLPGTAHSSHTPVSWRALSTCKFSLS